MQMRALRWPDISTRLPPQYSGTSLIAIARGHLGAIPFPPDPSGLGTVVHDSLLEPRVFECLFGRDTFVGIVNENPSEQIQKLFVELGGIGDDVLQQC